MNWYLTVYYCMNQVPAGETHMTGKCEPQYWNHTTKITFFIIYCSYCILFKLTEVFLCNSYSPYHEMKKRFCAGALAHNKGHKHKATELVFTVLKR